MSILKRLRLRVDGWLPVDNFIHHSLGLSHDCMAGSSSTHDDICRRSSTYRSTAILRLSSRSCTSIQCESFHAFHNFFDLLRMSLADNPYTWGSLLLHFPPDPSATDSLPCHRSRAFCSQSTHKKCRSALQVLKGHPRKDHLESWVAHCGWGPNCLQLRVRESLR